MCDINLIYYMGFPFCWMNLSRMKICMRNYYTSTACNHCLYMLIKSSSTPFPSRPSFSKALTFIVWQFKSWIWYQELKRNWHDLWHWLKSSLYFWHWIYIVRHHSMQSNFSFKNLDFWTSQGRRFLVFWFSEKASEGL